MKLSQILQAVFKVYFHEDEKRFCVHTKEHADELSEALKDMWSTGTGQVYGPFYDDKEDATWYEVSL